VTGKQTLTSKEVSHNFGAVERAKIAASKVCEQNQQAAISLVASNCAGNSESESNLALRNL
jgi:hypothetical protein